MRQLPIPPHFEPHRVGEVWRVDYARRAEEAEAWAARHGIRRARADVTKICLMLVDCQNTFCIPGYELYVAGRSGRGAVEDTIRVCEFIYRNLELITTIAPTMDTHTAMQIFHPIFWIDQAGSHPVGGTMITLEDVEQGKWKLNPAVADIVAGRDHAWLERYARHYVRKLTAGRYPLMVWPYHAMLGGISHALVSAVAEACFFHSMARASPTRFEIKGDNPLTENYSVLSPEVLEGPEGRPIGAKNTNFIQTLLEFDAVIVAGQAKSHCVAWTMHDLLSEVQAHDGGLVGKIYLLEDCTSPVVIPGVIDFTEQADDAFRRFAEAGVHLVNSTDSLASWVGMKVSGSA